MLMKSRTRKLILNVATSVAILMTALVVLTPAVTFAQPSPAGVSQDDASPAWTAAAGASALRYTSR